MARASLGGTIERIMSDSSTSAVSVSTRLIFAEAARFRVASERPCRLVYTEMLFAWRRRAIPLPMSPMERMPIVVVMREEDMVKEWVWSKWWKVEFVLGKKACAKVKKRRSLLKATALKYQ